MTEPKTIRIGICMAGAVSAGAYTAGVIDYLIEALENWQKAKDLNLPGVPKHDVKIEVLTGASAGGMTAAITACAVQQKFPHINQDNYRTSENTENPIYDAWVNLTETEDLSMMDQMLADDDIRGNKAHEVKSIFDSGFIERVASRIIDTSVKDPEVKRPYIADDLEILTTQTNLKGFNYELEFKTALGKSVHRMTRHQDLVHFKINDTGTYEGDGKIPLSFSTMEGKNKALLIDAAIATGAFPVGLSPRKVNREARYVLENPYLNTANKQMLLNKIANYVCVNVDGGVINNEPFGLTDQILAKRKQQEQEAAEIPKEAENDQIKKSASSFDTTLIMIDPFPSEQGAWEDEESLDAIKFAVPGLLNAMRAQLMFKEQELQNAFDEDEDNYTRFMVLPVRYKNEEKQNFALACGGLGGFAGFFKKEFREHDFMLGRRNCQLFLQKYFSVPADKENPILTFGYEGIDQFRVKPGDGETDFLPIIPDMRVTERADGTATLLTEVPEETGIDYDSVKMKLSVLMSLEELMKNRFQVVLKNILNGDKKNKGTAVESEIIARIRKKSKLNKFLNKKVMKLVRKIGIKQAKNIMAEKFIDAVIREMEIRKLLDDDLKNS